MFELYKVINDSIMITLFVFVMMLLVDYVNVLTKGKMERAIKGGRVRQYVISSFLGATPGCLGAFMNVSFYVHRLLSFGAIVGGMIATSGDESFVMLALFPGKALFLFTLLFGLGIAGAWISDKVASQLKIVPCEGCDLQVVHPEESYPPFYPIVFKEFFSKPSLSRYLTLSFLLVLISVIGMGHLGPLTWNWIKVTVFLLLFIAAFIVATASDHYLRSHIWQHIVKKHVWRVFLWTFFALLFINMGLNHWNIEAFIRSNMTWVFILSALIGLIPESGPHMVFVMMFANGLIPFSVLLTSSIVQDGHGMLPLFSSSVKDAVRVKIFNLIFGILVGLIFLSFGL